MTLFDDGSFDYIPDPLYNGPDSFSYQVTDGAEFSGVATVTLVVTPVNRVPVANDDSVSTPEDTPLTIDAQGVLENDSDADGDPLTAFLVSTPAHGSLTLNDDGSFTYTPTPLYSGPDSFTYRAFDGRAFSDAATVSLDVTFVNHAPTAQNDHFTTAEDTPLTIDAPGILANDGDVDAGQTLAVSRIALPMHGTLTLNPDGSFTYTPDPNYSGPDSFSYKANDQLLNSNPAIVSLTVTPVDDAPVAVADHFTTAEDTPLHVPAPGVLGNDTDAEGDPRTVLLVPGSTHGTVGLNEDGSFTYVPSANYNGADSFNYRVYDGTFLSGVGTVSLTVNPVDDAPVAAGATYVTPEDSPVIRVLAVTDIDGGPQTLSIVAAPAHGRVNLIPGGSFLYVPALNYNGPDSFTYKANDGTLDSNVATISVVVTPVNDLPLGAGVPIAAAQGTPVANVTVAIFNDVDHEVPGLYTASINWGDGTAATAGTVKASGTGYLVAGGHVYDAPGSFKVNVALNDAAGGQVVIPTTANVAPIPPQFQLSGLLGAGSDSGNPSDRITRVNTPTFLGTAPPGYVVDVFISIPRAQISIGRAIADAQGRYVFTSPPLTDGVYTFSVTAHNPNAPGSKLVLSKDLGSLAIDTAPPRVAGASFDPKRGLITVAYDDPAGIDLGSILSAASYKVNQVTASNAPGRNVPVTGVQVAGPTIPGGPLTVVLTLNGGKKIARGRLLIRTASGGVADVAGNALDGEFAGALPSGNGQAGGDFVALFSVNGRRVSGPTPAASASVRTSSETALPPTAIHAYDAALEQLRAIRARARRHR